LIPGTDLGGTAMLVRDRTFPVHSLSYLGTSVFRVSDLNTVPNV